MRKILQVLKCFLTKIIIVVSSEMGKRRNQRQMKGKDGFTLVELSLSIAFISVLSITVALLISNTIAAYHRGVVLDQVNTVGMQIVDDMRYSIQNAQARLCDEDCKYSWSGATGTFRQNDTNYNVVKYGAFCTGSYSYLWNSGYLFDGNAYKISGEKLSLRYRDGEGNAKTSSNFKLLKVMDEERAVCTMANNSNLIDISSGDISMVDEEPIDLMSGNSNGLALYSLNASSTPGQTLENTFYSVSFILGTIQGGINVKKSGDYCVPPSDTKNASAEAFDYCAINKFNFAAQANGGTSK